MRAVATAIACASSTIASTPPRGPCLSKNPEIQQNGVTQTRKNTFQHNPPQGSLALPFECLFRFLCIAPLFSSYSSRMRSSSPARPSPAYYERCTRPFTSQDKTIGEVQSLTGSTLGLFHLQLHMHTSSTCKVHSSDRMHKTMERKSQHARRNLTCNKQAKT